MSDSSLLAAELNRCLASHPALPRMFSQRSRGIAFPWRGILGQTAEAKGARLNATIGVALQDDGAPMHLRAVTGAVDLDPEQIVSYAPGHGLPALREAWAANQRRANPAMPATVTRPVVTAGLTHGLAVAGLLTCDPRDPLIVPEPCWDNYHLLFTVQYGTEPRPFPLFFQGRFHLDGLQERLREGDGKIVVLLNFPNNPTGYTLTVTEAEHLRAALVAPPPLLRDIVAIIDDAYAGLVYEKDVFPESLFSLLADAHERILAVKIDGCSKEDFAWGLRIAFLTFGCKGMTAAQARAMEDKAAGAVRATVSNASRLSQELLIRSVGATQEEAHRTGLRTILAERYRAARAAFMNTKCDQYADLLPCNSGYFLCLQLHAPLEAERVRQLLLHDHSTGTIALPGNLLRIAFASVSAIKMEELFKNISLSLTWSASSSSLTPPGSPRPVATRRRFPAASS